MAPFESASQGWENASGVSFEPAGSAAYVSDDDYLGKTFEPILRFDTSEQWRPLNVDNFMQEQDPNNPGHTYNQICQPPLASGSCTDLSSNWLGALQADPTGYIKMGMLPGQSYPTSPYPACYSNGPTGTVKECDTGSNAATYFHVAPPTASGPSKSGYNYVDSWIFYRYNQDQNDPLPGNGDNHQGDWEGVTVAPSPKDPLTFDFAIYAQHADLSVYAPGNLECDQGGAGSCLQGGQRPWDYVATGTHASYPGSDTGGFTGICDQAQEALPEGCHDGAAPWGANYDSTDALQFPAALGWGSPWDNQGAPSTANWVDWPGTWGHDAGTDYPGIGTLGVSPRSPGRQARFECPGTPTPTAPNQACPARVLTINPLSPSAANEAASNCGNWFGGMVMVTACSPSRLRQAVHSATVGRRGALRIEVSHRRGQTAALRGVAQAVGQPLTPGESITLVGHGPPDTALLVRAVGAGRQVDAEFTDLGMARGGRATLRVYASRHGVRLLFVTPQARTIRPTWMSAIRLPHGAKLASDRPGLRRTSGPARALGGTKSSQERRVAACMGARFDRWLRAMTDWEHARLAARRAARHLIKLPVMNEMC